MGEQYGRLLRFALFGFVPLSIVEMGTVVGIVIAYLAATELAKRWVFRRGGATPA